MQLSRDYNKKSNTQDPELPPVLNVWAWVLYSDEKQVTVIISVYEYTRMYNKIRIGVLTSVKTIQLIKPKNLFDYTKINDLDTKQLNNLKKYYYERVK
jgi:hypothetical protein